MPGKRKIVLTCRASNCAGMGWVVLEDVKGTDEERKELLERKKKLNMVKDNPDFPGNDKKASTSRSL